MSTLAPEPPGLPRSRTRDLFTGTFCPECAFAERCPCYETDAACGDPLQYPDDLHPARTKVLHPIRSELVPVPELAVDHPLEDLLIVADHSPSATRAMRARDALLLASRRRSSLRSPKPDRGLAVLIGNDDLMARIWRDEYRLGRWLRDAGFRAVIGPGFSTYWASNPFVIQTNIERSASVARALARHLPTIPCLVWGCDEDIARQIRWIVASGCRAFAVDLGPLAKGVGWQWAMQGLVEARSNLTGLGWPTRLVVNGVSSADHIKQIIDLWPWDDVTFLTRSPWIQAQKHRVLGPDLVAQADPGTRAPAEVLADSKAAMESMITEAKISRRSTAAPAAVATVLAAHAVR